MGRETEERSLRIHFQQIGFLRPVPGRVAAAAYTARKSVGHFVTVVQRHCCLHVILFRENLGPILGIEIQHRQARLSGRPVRTAVFTHAAEAWRKLHHAFGQAHADAHFLIVIVPDAPVGDESPVTAGHRIPFHTAQKEILRSKKLAFGQIQDYVILQVKCITGFIYREI